MTAGATATPSARPRTSDLTVLVTGASGVLGQALLDRLDASTRVVALTRRRPVTEGATGIAGDVCSPNLGLDRDAYASLTETVDVVVNLAGVVDFGAPRDRLHAVNVDGARRVAQFAADAHARLVHVSTAYVARHDQTAEAARVAGVDGDAGPVNYLATKIAGERAVTAVTDAVIVRPSIVIGHSRTGAIVEHQGLHRFVRLLVGNKLPFVPALRGSWLDFVPQDVVADAIDAVIGSGARAGEHWVSAGPAALRCDDLIGIVVDEAARRGITVDPLRYLGPDMVGRLIKPAFYDVVPRADRFRLDRLLEVGSLFTTEPLPSTLADLPACAAAATPAASARAWRASVGAQLDARTRRTTTGSNDAEAHDGGAS